MIKIKRIYLFYIIYFIAEKYHLLLHYRNIYFLCLFLIVEYGSILSYPSAENHVNSSTENVRTSDQIIHKFETDDVHRENMSENAVLPSHDSITDHDLHWEMNYHEAAIFLEVFIHLYVYIPI